MLSGEIAPKNNHYYYYYYSIRQKNKEHCFDFSGFNPTKLLFLRNCHCLHGVLSRFCLSLTLISKNLLQAILLVVNH